MPAVDAQLGDQQAQESLGLLGLALCNHIFELVGGPGMRSDPAPDLKGMTQARRGHSDDLPRSLVID